MKDHLVACSDREPDIALLEQLLAIPSPSGAEDALAEFLIARMAALGFQAYRDAVGNAIGVAGNPQAERTVLLLGHMDTVTDDIPTFRRGNLLYGRGAVDAKGPLATFVLAAAQAAPHLARTRLVVIGAVEEESPAGRGAHHLIETLPAPDYVIIGEPSGWEGITLGYKGILSVDYRRVQPAGHSAGQFPGPAEKAVTFWNRLMTYAEEVNGGRFDRFDTLDPALREFHTFREGPGEGVRMNIVCRLPPSCDVRALQQQMSLWSDGATLSFPGYEPAYRAQKNTPLVRALLRAIRAADGRPRFKLKTGTSDMNVVARTWACPMVAYGPGDSSLDHTPEERIDVREFRRSIGILTEVLESL